MNENDESELNRLCDLLESLDKSLERSDARLEAVRKAAFALHLAFWSGKRKRIELFYDNPPLSEEELGRLRRLGIDPDVFKEEDESAP